MTASVHRRTPTVTVADGRGLILRQIAYLRTFVGEPTITLITRQMHDAAGHQIAQYDPRLPVPAESSVYGLNGQPLKVDSVDAGWRLSLPGLSGQALQRWDGRGVHWHIRYDDLLHVVSINNSADAASETFSYADASADAGHNLRGRFLELHDPSGGLRLHGYDLLGKPSRETRTFTDAKAFVSGRTFSPLGAVLEQIDAGGHRQQSRYDLAGHLKHLQVRLAGHNESQAVLLEARINAAGQVIEQQAGNGVSSHWRYDPANGRLHRQWAQKGTQTPLQDFEYQYDPVGNITGILDHVFMRSHFANQRVEGHRQFDYDSLYRLHSASGYDDAPPADVPGRPLPTNPDDRRNYLQTFTYDHGGNLLQLQHVRDGASHTRQMSIDTISNRGVRWTSGDLPPDFGKLFDCHGNFNALQAGQPLLWDARDQLARITLIIRDNGLDDAEYYHYSQGVRVHKRHESHSANARHFHDVRYLPNLEIRTRDNGEELHVIRLDVGIGHVTCLHWVSGKPPGIAADQLRYTLDDHLGSCSMELDRLARLISHEGYYAFGATAWMTASSAIEVDYKILRYSGKEMDVSGLYYYGARYYAPWLQRWISADQARDIDGLNLYGFVGNNPMSYFDDGGFSRSPSELKRQITWNARVLSAVDKQMQTLQGQLVDLQYPRQWRATMAKNVLYQVGSAATGWFSSFNAAGGASEAIPEISADLIGLTLGNNVADKSVGIYDSLVAALSLNTPIVPRTSTFNRAAISAEVRPSSALPSAEKYDVRTREGLQQLAMDGISKVVGAYVPGVAETMALGSTAQEANEAEEGLSPMKLGKIQSTLDDLGVFVSQLTSSTNAAFAELGVEEFYDQQHGMRDYLIDLALNRVGTTKAKTVRQSDVTQLAGQARNNINISREFLSIYRDKVPAIRSRYRAS
jgi:insecticidal toxin complex protein TccC